MQLGKLEKIPLRDGWKHEALNFTNWLAEPQNLQLLSDEIGIDISLIQTEASVGKGCGLNIMFQTAWYPTPT